MYCSRINFLDYLGNNFFIPLVYIRQRVLIDSDNKLHDDHTSIHAPFGEGVIDFEEVVPAIRKAGFSSDWWTIDLCFWPDAWEITEASKRYLDGLFTKLGMK